MSENVLKERLGPAAWIDEDDGLHFDIPELLKECGLPDTQFNRAKLTALAMELIRHQCPEAEIVKRPDPPPPK